MINQPSMSNGIVVIPQRGNFLAALNAKIEKSKSWIVDLGTLNHATVDTSLFNYTSHNMRNIIFK